MKERIKPMQLPIIPLRGTMLFPYTLMHFDVGREKSVAALEAAMMADQEVVLVMQKDPLVDEPAIEDLHEVGTACYVRQILKLPGDTIRVLVEGIDRCRIEEMVDEDVWTARLSYPAEKSISLVQGQARMRAIQEALEQYAQVSSRISSQINLFLENEEDAGRFADIVAANSLVKIADRQTILECFDVKKRLDTLYKILRHETQIASIEQNIHKQVRKQMDKNQRDYVLREQLKVIHKELGDTQDDEMEGYRRRIEAAKLPKAAHQKANVELDRLDKLQASSPESGVIRGYLDWILSLPWHERTKDNLDLKRAARILDQDHYGLEKVKERIIEYLAVRKLKADMKGPILCLVGPPGVGKTSIARSVARAIDRNFVRMSLGGVGDEAELRGHRRTYIGAMPGRVLSLLKNAGTCNPVFLFDEVDKMGRDMRGDPAAAMLEVLDPEQNHEFSDHYLEIPFDLSHVLFLTTANAVETIPAPLLDRMEVIELSGYTQEEKISIAQRHLIKKQMERNGIDRDAMRIGKRTLALLIEQYTRESGVRELEREIAALCRKTAFKITQGEKRVTITAKNLESFLGQARWRHKDIASDGIPGVANGLAWTSVGGVVLTVEALCIPGGGKVELTGKLGEVMKESAQAALSYLRAHATEMGLETGFADQKDLHIHIPEGATPKDGPSAGITMATAIVSSVLNKPVRQDLAMTGEITLTGRVLPVGGIKEKMLAAHRAGIRLVALPVDNQKDLEQLPQSVTQQMQFIPVQHLREVLQLAFALLDESGQAKGQKHAD